MGFRDTWLVIIVVGFLLVLHCHGDAVSSSSELEEVEEDYAEGIGSVSGEEERSSQVGWLRNLLGIPVKNRVQLHFQSGYEDAAPAESPSSYENDGGGGRNSYSGMPFMPSGPSVTGSSSNGGSGSSPPAPVQPAFMFESPAPVNKHRSSKTVVVSVVTTAVVTSFLAAMLFLGYRKFLARRDDQPRSERPLLSLSNLSESLKALQASVFAESVTRDEEKNLSSACVNKVHGIASPRYETDAKKSSEMQKLPSSRKLSMHSLDCYSGDESFHSTCETPSLLKILQEHSWESPSPPSSPYSSSSSSPSVSLPYPFMPHPSPPIAFSDKIQVTSIPSASSPLNESKLTNPPLASKSSSPARSQVAVNNSNQQNLRKVNTPPLTSKPSSPASSPARSQVAVDNKNQHKLSKLNTPPLTSKPSSPARSQVAVDNSNQHKLSKLTTPPLTSKPSSPARSQVADNNNQQELLSKLNATPLPSKPSSPARSQVAVDNNNQQKLSKLNAPPLPSKPSSPARSQVVVDNNNQQKLSEVNNAPLASKLSATAGSQVPVHNNFQQKPSFCTMPSKEAPSSLPPLPPRPPPLLLKGSPNSTQKPNRQGMEKSCSSHGDEVSLPKLKPLHWDKVRAPSDRTMVWSKLRSGSFEFDEEMIETLFGYSANRTMQSDLPRTSAPTPKVNQWILEPRRAQNISIQLRALPMKIEEVCDALLKGENLSMEILEILAKMVPTREEEAKLKECNGDMNKLSPAEKFLKALLNIPSVFRRIDAMLFKATFDEEVAYIQTSLETLELACRELKCSRLFLKLLEAVLKTGNRMNVGTFRGQAEAFKLDALLKLSDIKGIDGKTTLLHFVVQEIIRSEGMHSAETRDKKIGTTSEKRNQEEREEEYRELGLRLVSGLSTELCNVKKVAGIDSEQLAISLSKLSQEFEKLNQVQHPEFQSIANEAVNTGENFYQSMASFLHEAEKRIKNLKVEEERIFSLVKNVTEYFHGDSAKEEARPLRIFVIVRDFLGALDNVCREIGRRKGNASSLSSERSFSPPLTANPVSPVKKALTPKP